MTVKNLAMISTEIENNKKNTIYISALIDEFKEVYNDKVGSSNTFFMLINQHAGNYEDALQKMSTDIETMKKTSIKSLLMYSKQWLINFVNRKYRQIMKFLAF